MIGIGATSFLLLLLLLAGGVWVGLALMGTGAAALMMFRDLDVGAFLAGDVWRGLSTPEFAALPLFILMGDLLYRSRLAQDLFSGLAPLVRHIPGGLMHTNILGCTLFAAVSGSSAATTATVGRITLEELQQRDYDRDLALGSLCGAGTLGFLIPPSLILIIYGVLANTSILDLFIAGIMPGLLLALAYMLYVAARLGTGADRAASPLTMLAGLRKLGPVAGLILLVIGSLYAGWAGPSEAAVIGVTGALAILAIQGELGRPVLAAALMGAVRTSAMIALIIAGAGFLSKAMAIFGLPQAVAAGIAALDLSPLLLIIALLVFYILLGTVLDGLSIIVMTLPIALPPVLEAGFSPVWFGIFLVLVVEMSQITPPVGFNLFVVQGLTGEAIGRIARASLPFFLINVAMVALITLAPGIVLWPL